MGEQDRWTDTIQQFGTGSLHQLLRPLKTVLASKVLIELTLTGFVYASTQVCLLSFLVVYLNAELGEPLVAAGFALTVATIGGVVGRVVWGLVADRKIAPRRMLALLGVVAGACALACAALSELQASSYRLSLRAIRPADQPARALMNVTSSPSARSRATA